MRKGLSLAVIALLALGLSLSACGRRGPLERPATAETTNNGAPAAHGYEADETQVADAPSRPFILDGLLR